MQYRSTWTALYSSLPSLVCVVASTCACACAGVDCVGPYI